MNAEQLLLAIEDAIRLAPNELEVVDGTPEALAWLGRVAALVENWNAIKAIASGASIMDINSGVRSRRETGLRSLIVLLHQARTDIAMRIAGPTAVAIPHRMTFDYFDEIRKIIGLAKQDILFVDPYIEAEFVSRYLPYVGAGVTIRLLAREKMAALLPAVDIFAKQSGASVQVRSAPNFHDRYIFLDRCSCYQSGASFKDGARTAPTTITQILDAFPAMQATYESIWSGGQVQR